MDAVGTPGYVVAGGLKSRFTGVFRNEGGDLFLSPAFFSQRAGMLRLNQDSGRPVGKGEDGTQNAFSIAAEGVGRVNGIGE